MKLLILLGVLLNFYLISSLNFECDVLNEEMLSKNVINIYIMHSFKVTNSNIYNKNIKTSITFPVNRESNELPKIYEHLNGSEPNYSIVFNDSNYVGLFPVTATKMQLISQFAKACGTEEQMERFVIVLIVDEPKYSILLYGCNVVTGKNVIIAMFESKTGRIMVQDLVKIDLNMKQHLFQLVNGDNEGSCLCNSSRQYTAECLKHNFQATDKATYSVINNMFYIYVAITFVMIILVYVIHRVTKSSNETHD